MGSVSAPLFTWKKASLSTPHDDLLVLCVWHYLFLDLAAQTDTQFIKLMGNEDYLVRQSLPTNSDYVFVQVEIAIANASSGKGSRTASISGRTRPNSTICS